jgi:phenol hydroxylase P0 protein
MTCYKANKIMMSAPSEPTLPEKDSVALEADAATMARRYVRITSRSATGFVNFEYSVGWPDMSVELALPEELFNDFCIKNNVQFLDEPVENKLGEHDE